MKNSLIAAALSRRMIVPGSHNLSCSVSTAAVDQAASILRNLPDDGEPMVRVDVSASVRNEVIANRLSAMGWARPLQATMLTQALQVIAGGMLPNASTLAEAGDWQTFTTELQRIAREALASCSAHTPPTEGTQA